MLEKQLIRTDGHEIGKKKLLVFILTCVFWPATVSFNWSLDIANT